MIRALSPYGVWIAAAVVMLVMPLIFTGGFALSLMSQMGVAIIFALAYNMLLGQGGMLSFGHAVYFGIAGYACAHFLNMMGENIRQNGPGTGNVRGLSRQYGSRICQSGWRFSLHRPCA